MTVHPSHPSYPSYPSRPARRRPADALSAVLVPVAACGVALAALTIWVTAGQAGSPPRIEVAPGRVFLPYGGTTETAAFFSLLNSGGADDRLVRVTSTATGGEPALSRHRMNGSGAAYREGVDAVTVPAGGGVLMSPAGVDVTLRAERVWRVGDTVPFTLHFEHSGPVSTTAVVIRPADGAP